MFWVTFFSQTGSEIAEICKRIQKWPDIVCTNKPISEIGSINSDLLQECFNKILFLPAKPTVAEYTTACKSARKNHNSIITLHGYLRIIPKTICDLYSIYNGHPGDITTHPCLKGFNPQEKAYNLKIKETGSVIHRVTAEVDDGPIAAFKKCKINLKSMKSTYEILHNNSVNLWVEFLTKTFNIKK